MWILENKIYKISEDKIFIPCCHGYTFYGNFMFKCQKECCFLYSLWTIWPTFKKDLAEWYNAITTSVGL